MNGVLIAFGGNQFNPRSPAILAVAKANNLNIETVTIPSAQEAPDYYRKLNPLAKVPTFVGSDGFVLSECIAIALHSTCKTPIRCWMRQNGGCPLT
jgi:elongation factor 1-gamma